MTKRSTRNLPSEVEQVAALEIGQAYWKVRALDLPYQESTSDAIQREKRLLSSAATTTIGRVRNRHPDRNFELASSAFVASDNVLYIAVQTKRVPEAPVTLIRVSRKRPTTS